MSQRQVIARSRRRARAAASIVLDRGAAPASRFGGRGALLSGTALAALVACGLFGFSDRALAQAGATLPTGGVVVGGSATITQSGTSQLTINQTTDRGVIDWRSFSIGQGNRVDFIQPGSTSVTLNRVTGPDPSLIAGRLTANGQIVLINQAGVMFAGGAQVNVESLIASTANVANPQAFMAGGKIAFDQAGANPNARIVNDGTITVRDGGLVALLGPSAANNGVINARLGRVTIGGAETFTVDLNGDGLLNFVVGKPVSQTPRDADGKALALASNTGTINANGGVVAITASAARGVVDGVVNVQGQINARTVTNEGGVIVFGGGESTQVNVGGTTDVSGAGATQKGGTVSVTASKVSVQSTARINANGGAGGGTVLVGGGKQGAGPIANAKNTSVAKGAIITADATYKGNGGTVIIWADNTTVFAGTISAKGGPQGGHGGFAEVSGKIYLSFDGVVDLRATDGFQTGTLLLDPSDITISNSADSNIDPSGGDPNTITGTANASNIKASTIEGLLPTANVIVDAAGGAGAGTGSITVNENIVAATTNTLTFNALTD
ncbi:MAG: filamentous hemagglutinin N-terminal domain-containing protein, partial [Alphaproteobacteria bacterium]|nr:filamentous hemagglutinin N-terminal domain-containing protein [Alphaproteobacteria bacterium]